MALGYATNPTKRGKTRAHTEPGLNHNPDSHSNKTVYSVKKRAVTRSGFSAKRRRPPRKGQTSMKDFKVRYDTSLRETQCVGRNKTSIARKAGLVVPVTLIQSERVESKSSIDTDCCKQSSTRQNCSTNQRICKMGKKKSPKGNSAAGSSNQGSSSTGPSGTPLEQGSSSGTAQKETGPVTPQQSSATSQLPHALPTNTVPENTLSAPTQQQKQKQKDTQQATTDQTSTAQETTEETNAEQTTSGSDSFTVAHGNSVENVAESDKVWENEI